MKVSAIITLSAAALINFASAATIQRRDFEQPLCGLVEGGDPQSTSPRVEGLPYLRGKWNDDCGAPARTCQTKSCSWNSRIEVCNDNNHDVHIPCGRVADGAEAIMNKCGDYHKGQVFNNGPAGGWNIVVRAGSC
ncbi:hypothetical protein TWF696_001137 [Orbilia brochopaga]|uniref:Uncharacterized protein n=1 Tax=Orbilia brochopaga TaxID=3140254 RepID=A0AAV9VDF7_9PEZI